MLLIVLVCVMAAFGLLVTALLTGTAAWAWGSVAASVAAALLLLADQVRRRSAERPGSRQRRPAPSREPSKAAVERDAPIALASVTTTDGSAPGPSGSAPGPSGAQSSDELRPGDSSLTVTLADPDEDDEPAAEAGDEGLLYRVAKLPDEVLVIDERPRYHLAECSFLHGRSTIALPVSEAVELGFTGCARCTPNHALAARRGVGTTT